MKDLSTILPNSKTSNLDIYAVSLSTTLEFSSAVLFSLLTTYPKEFLAALHVSGYKYRNRRTYSPCPTHKQLQGSNVSMLFEKGGHIASLTAWGASLGMDWGVGAWPALWDGGKGRAFLLSRELHSGRESLQGLGALEMTEL